MSKEGKTARINCRATPRIVEALFKIAKLEERSASDTMCRLIREEADRRGMWKAEGDAKGEYLALQQCKQLLRIFEKCWVGSIEYAIEDPSSWIQDAKSWWNKWSAFVGDVRSALRDAAADSEGDGGER